MPDYLRVDPKRDYCQTEQDEKIGSLECYHAANLESSLLAKTFGVGSSFLGCGKTDSFSLLCGPFSHALARLSDRLDAQNAQIVSHRLLLRPGCSDVVFALYDAEDIAAPRLFRLRCPWPLLPWRA
jgi:hypothetical protein